MVFEFLHFGTEIYRDGLFFPNIVIRNEGCVLDMSEPVKILDMARRMIDWSGLKWYQVPIKLGQ